MEKITQAVGLWDHDTGMAHIIVCSWSSEKNHDLTKKPVQNKNK